MFAGIVPAKIESALQRAGLLLYGARISPAKGGPILHLAANYPYKKEQCPPLDEEESQTLRQQVKDLLLKRGYRSKMKAFVFEGDVDCNDFRLKVLLPLDDVDADQYAEIKRLSVRNKL